MRVCQCGCLVTVEIIDILPDHIRESRLRVSHILVVLELPLSLGLCISWASSVSPLLSFQSAQLPQELTRLFLWLSFAEAVRSSFLTA